MGAAADKLRFLYLCAAHDLAAATRNVMNPGSDPITGSGSALLREADRWLSGNVAYDQDGFPFANPISHTYGTRASGLSGASLFAGQYLAPRNGTDGVALNRSFSLPAPANVFYGSSGNPTKRLEVGYPGQSVVFHGVATTTFDAGFLAFGRDGTSALGWVDGVPANSPQTTAQPTINFTASGARGYVSYSPALRVSIHCIGETMTDAEVSTLNTAFRNYLTAIGAPVA